MDPPSPNSQRRFFTTGQPYNSMMSNAKVEPTNVKETNTAFHHIPSIKTAKASQCNWQKVMIVICIIHAIILVVAVIVIPIYISRLIMSDTTTAATTTVSLPNQCSNYTLDTDATRLLTYTIGTSGCDVSTYATPLKYCSKIYMCSTFFLGVTVF
ncbi:unnamed protein product [Rotaria magnacalcarata]|uniref:Uncharacterized protein n=1 Tax=Rotaria magnacalcarata TaxID=392030 RepID=A0A816Z612_9BILA|nr:unnamed protein product [Rotaria magnacalcarata]CAF1389771.1 unnamed protein product [Rotaria magnacalcarata]CAF2129338.1 unnamed protein product [Rotaria magnacalcarata]CAF2179965.1 unnamed protein product [Rotaria magnacalcarata]CAF2225464.1 unnamed protein product [Rotaria magnacalcarata]